MCILMLHLTFLSMTMGAATVDNASPLETRFRLLGKDAPWERIETRDVDFQTYHPQGMTAVGQRFFLSSVQVIDRRTDTGTGHLFEMDRNGALLRQTTLGEGVMYHPGGIDYDGEQIWVSVGAYRPNSSSIVYTVDPDSMGIREVFHFDDHLGAISHFPDKNLLVAVSWGSRLFYRWETEVRDGQRVVSNPDNPVVQPNGNHYIDYQDMQRLPGTPYLLCSGIQMYSQPGDRFPSLRLGGMDLVSVEELRAHHQIPVPLRAAAAPAWTQNPFYVEAAEEGLRFFFVPEDNASVLHIFEIKIKK